MALCCRRCKDNVCLILLKSINSFHKVRAKKDLNLFALLHKRALCGLWHFSFWAKSNQWRMVHNSKLEFQLRKQIENGLEFLRFRSVWKRNETVLKTNRFEFWPNNKFQIVECTATDNCSPYLCVTCTVHTVHSQCAIVYQCYVPFGFSSFKIVCWFIILPEKKSPKLFPCHTKYKTTLHLALHFHLRKLNSLHTIIGNSFRFCI